VGAHELAAQHTGHWGLDRQACGIEYSHAGLIALLHRLGLAYRKPDLVARKLDPAKQKAFIEAYERLLRELGVDEAAVFADAVHPTHQVRAVGCWAPKDEAIAIAPSSGRDRLNIHGAINLETGKTQMVEVLTVDAQSTIALLMAILAALSVDADDPRFSRPGALPSRHASAGMAGAARPSDHAAFHPDLQSPSQSDRAALGGDAQERHPQPISCHLPRFRSRRDDLSRKTGRASAIRSQIISASSTQQIFGS
jgi:hypothetical protein